MSALGNWYYGGPSQNQYLTDFYILVLRQWTTCLSPRSSSSPSQSSTRSKKTTRPFSFYFVKKKPFLKTYVSAPFNFKTWETSDGPLIFYPK